MINRLKALVLLFIGGIKRALCCFRRRRKVSFDSVPLTTIGVVPNYAGSISDERNPTDLQSWNSWDENPVSIITENKPSSIQQHIELYRQKSRHATDPEETEPQPDLFEDMVPKITRQPKILLKVDSEPAKRNESLSSRLTLSEDTQLFASADLETWEDSQGWEDQTQEDWNADTILREKRQLEKQRRLAELQQKRQLRTGGLGARISS